MPSDVPLSFQIECKILGANVTLIDGLITDCGIKVKGKKIFQYILNFNN